MRGSAAERILDGAGTEVNTELVVGDVVTGHYQAIRATATGKGARPMEYTQPGQWSVYCEVCGWSVSCLPSKDRAEVSGRLHSFLRNHSPVVVIGLEYVAATGDHLPLVRED